MQDERGALVPARQVPPEARSHPDLVDVIHTDLAHHRPLRPPMVPSMWR